MFTIRKARLDEALTARLMELSALWVAEDCSNGMVANGPEDLKEPLWIALDGETVIGYAFGHYYTAEKRSSYILPGSRCFDLDELYVLPERRSEGIGKALYEALREEVRREAEYVTLATSTKDWRRILHFYTEEVGMDFHSAFLIQRVSEQLPRLTKTAARGTCLPFPPRRRGGHWPPARGASLPVLSLRNQFSNWSWQSVLLRIPIILRFPGNFEKISPQGKIHFRWERHFT